MDSKNERDKVARFRLMGYSWKQIAKLLGNTSATTLNKRYKDLPTLKEQLNGKDIAEVNKKIFNDMKAYFNIHTQKKKKSPLNAFLEKTKNQTVKGTYTPQHWLAEKK